MNSVFEFTRKIIGTLSAGLHNTGCKLVAFLLLLSLGQQASAQTFAEWWSQKKTQKKYLVQQIGLLQLYLGYVKKGYDIAHKGLSLIGDIKNGDFGIHRDYFSSLESVSPTVKKYNKVAAIMNYLLLIQKGCRPVSGDDPFGRQLSIQERTYVNFVLGSLLGVALEDVARLTAVLTAGDLKMKESERLDRISYIYSEIEDKYNFMRSFLEENQGLAVSRIREQDDVFLLKRLHEQ